MDMWITKYVESYLNMQFSWNSFTGKRANTKNKIILSLFLLLRKLL